MAALSDIALIAQVVTFGSERAFAQLVKAHQDAVRRFLRRLTNGDEMLADDLAQETFIRAWQHLSSFRQLSGFETWLLRIAYRVFLDEMRKEKNRPDSPPALPVREGAVTSEDGSLLPASHSAPKGSLLCFFFPPPRPRPGPRHPLRNRTNVCHPPVHRGTEYKRDSRDYRSASEHRQESPPAWQEKLS